MSKNILLVQGEVGKVTPATYNLPSEDFRYGIRTKSNGSVADCFKCYDTEDEPCVQERCLTSRRQKKAKVDYIATNKKALKSGCLTARDFREFKESHTIPVRQIERNSELEREVHQKKIDDMVHGIKTPVVEEIKDCMTYKTLNDSMTRAIQNKAANEEKARRKKAMKPNLRTGTRSTKASRGHTFKPAPPPSEADTFKIKRFREIQGYAIDDKWK